MLSTSLCSRAYGLGHEPPPNQGLSFPAHTRHSWDLGLLSSFPSHSSLKLSVVDQKPKLKHTEAPILSLPFSLKCVSSSIAISDHLLQLSSWRIWQGESTSSFFFFFFLCNFLVFCWVFFEFLQTQIAKCGFLSSTSLLIVLFWFF